MSERVILAVSFNTSVYLGGEQVTRIYNEDAKTRVFSTTLAKISFDRDERFLRVQSKSLKILVPLTNVGSIELEDQQKQVSNSN